MLTPSSVGAYFDSFSSSCSSTWRNRVSSPTAMCGAGRPLPADRVRAQQEPERLDGLVDRLDRVERRPRQPGQALAADGRQDRVDLAVEPGELVVGGVAPVSAVATSGIGVARSPPRPAGRRRRGRPTAASAGRGSRPRAARRGPHRARSAGPAAPRPRRSAGPSRRCRRAAPRSCAGTRSPRRRRRRGSRVWTLSTPTTWSCHIERHRQHPGQRLDVEAADPGEPVVERDVLDRDRLARWRRPAR